MKKRMTKKKKKKLRSGYLALYFCSLSTAFEVACTIIFLT